VQTDLLVYARHISQKADANIPRHRLECLTTHSQCLKHPLAASHAEARTSQIPVHLSHTQQIPPNPVNIPMDPRNANALHAA
jgi:hypothetical protein